MHESSDGFLVSDVQLDADIRTSTVPQVIQRFETAAAHISNNGIFQDGGLTELYEQETVYDLINNEQIYVASNGKTLIVGNGQIKILPDNVVFPSPILDSATATTSIGRQLINLNLEDAILTTDDANIWCGTIDEAHHMHIGIINTGADVNTFVEVSVITAVTVLAMSIVRTETLDLLTNPDIFFIDLSGNYKIAQWGGGVYTILNCALAAGATALLTPEIFRNNQLICYQHGTSYVFNAMFVASPNAGIYKFVSPYAAAVKITSPVKAANGISMLGKIGITGTTLTLGVCQLLNTEPHFQITITNAGVVATVSSSNVYYPNYATFTMTDGVISPWGCSGYGTDTATGFNIFSMSNLISDKKDNASVYNQIPELISALTTPIAPFSIEIKTYKGNVALLSPTASGPAINDFGGGSSDHDLSPFLDFNTPGYMKTLFYVPSIGGGSAANQQMLYRLNNMSFVLVTFYPYNILFNEIAPGVVSINNVNALSSIIDTNENKIYDNLSANIPVLVNTTPGKMFVNTFNKYSNGLDVGEWNLTPAYPISNGNWNIYNGTSGAYIGTGSTTIKYFDSTVGTYSFIPWLPLSIDSTFEGGGFITLQYSGIQQPEYFGYQIANQFPKKYNHFFMLYGIYYCNDDRFIYRIDLSGGSVGTVSGVPQPMVAINGLVFIASSPNKGYFLSSYDNSIWVFDGGHKTEKMKSFSNKETIQLGVYNGHDNALYLITLNKVITIRDGIVTENDAPYAVIFGTLRPYIPQNTSNGIYFVNHPSLSYKRWTYYPLTGSIIIPLSYRTAYFGMRENQLMTVQRIACNVLYDGLTATQLTLNWYWTTQDDSGVQTQTITPTINSQGYARFEWLPFPNNVVSGSMEIITTDTSQKIVLLEQTVYYKADAEANLVSHSA